MLKINKKNDKIYTFVSRIKKAKVGERREKGGREKRRKGKERNIVRREGKK